MVNPNIATYQTSEGVADTVYFLPITPYFVEKIIEKESPDAIALSFGGQTALNCGVELHDKGILNKHNVKVLGTSVQTIKDTEDRDLFIKRLDEINVKTPKSIAASSITAAQEAALKIGFPIMIRAAFALGGKGSGAAHNAEQLNELLLQAFSHSKQVLIEEYLGGWKEIEYEVVRDKDNNCITVCNMENFDPLGIHTGESIVVAPSQTLNNSEYHKLREIAIKVIQHLGIVGECNIQYALDPKSEDYRVIEVNARLSRSSALASKATGYPLAFVAAKLGLGHTLPNIPNAITKVTSACFEPALDYVVVKVPRWDLNKFKEVSKIIGTEMKSVGEVMAIGRTFEEALQKSLRMLQVGLHGLVANTRLKFKDLEHSIRNPTQKRVFGIGRALMQGVTVQQIHEWSGIDPWFLQKMQNIVQIAKNLETTSLDKDLLLEAKKAGFSDHQIAKLTKRDNEEILNLRKQLKINPFVKQIDTLAGEFPAKTNYLYITYNAAEHDIEFPRENSVIVLGSGAYRIGSSVEFDWCCVSAVKTARSLGYKTIMINYNPETVSTDYDECDRLYFDELSFETVTEIYNLERPKGIIVSMGGQIPNTLAMRLHRRSIPVLGTSPLDIDRAEDRHKFSKLLDELNIDQPVWSELSNIGRAKEFAKTVGYPVLIRPSYVLSGSAMNVVFDDEMLGYYLNVASTVSIDHPVVMSKFIENAKEVEIDAVANKGEIILHAISEHIENAGVHSGDATLVLPAQKTYSETERKIKRIAQELAKNLNITGPFNIQFIAADNNVKVIECNLRASRSFPFASKIFKINFIDTATRAILQEPIPTIKQHTPDYVGVKCPQFSFSRLKGADPLPSVEMASTGEVACLGADLYEAFLKSFLSVDMEIPKKNILITIRGDKLRYEILEGVRKLHKAGFKLYATEDTYHFFNNQRIPTTMVHKIHEAQQPNILDMILANEFDLIISISDHLNRTQKTDTSLVRRHAVDFSIPLINNVQIANIFAEAITRKGMGDLEIKSWGEYQLTRLI